MLPKYERIPSRRTVKLPISSGVWNYGRTPKFISRKKKGIKAFYPLDLFVKHWRGRTAGQPVRSHVIERHWGQNLGWILVKTWAQMHTGFRRSVNVWMKQGDLRLPSCQRLVIIIIASRERNERQWSCLVSVARFCGECAPIDLTCISRRVCVYVTRFQNQPYIVAAVSSVLSSVFLRTLFSWPITLPWNRQRDGCDVSWFELSYIHDTSVHTFQLEDAMIKLRSIPSRM